jgi:ABC-type multidrug transport system ATPase subunit
MRVILENIGKRYNDEWIFRHLDFEFSSSDRCAITGPNGSGKSTLLSIISSRLTPDEGKIIFETDGKTIGIEQAYKYISVCSPYIELIEEFTLKENIDFYISFKKLIHPITTQDLLKIIDLKTIQKKTLHQFSSGMKQRVKIAFALLADVEMVLLDEPCTNLDAEGMQWYQETSEKYAGCRILIIASNKQNQEYSFCAKNLSIPCFKK